jgi:hypothetical protein
MLVDIALNPSSRDREFCAEHSRRLAAMGKRDIQNSLIDFIMRMDRRTSCGG